MPIISEVTIFIVMALCLILSPIDSAFEARIETFSQGEMEFLSIMHDSAGSALHFYEINGEEYKLIFSVERDMWVFNFTIPDESEVLTIDLKDYLDQNTLSQIESLNMGDINSLMTYISGSIPMTIIRSGMVLYMEVEEIESMLFSIHE